MKISLQSKENNIHSYEMSVYNLLKAKPTQTFDHFHFYLPAKADDIDAHLQAPLTHTRKQALQCDKKRWQEELCRYIKFYYSTNVFATKCWARHATNVYIKTNLQITVIIYVGICTIS